MRSLLQSEEAAEPSLDVISAHQDVISAHQWDSSVLVSTVSSTPWLWRQLGLVILLSLSMLVRVTCMELCYFYSTRSSTSSPC